MINIEYKFFVLIKYARKEYENISKFAKENKLGIHYTYKAFSDLENDGYINKVKKSGKTEYVLTQKGINLLYTDLINQKINYRR